MIFSVQKVESFPGRIRRNGENLRGEMNNLILSMKVGETVKITPDSGERLESFSDALYKAARAIGCKVRSSTNKQENCIYIKRES